VWEKLTRVTLHGWLQVGAFARLLAAVAFHVRGARFAHCPTMLTLRNWPTLFIDVLQGTICTNPGQISIKAYD
jgi:hypothetical protein